MLRLQVSDKVRRSRMTHNMLLLLLSAESRSSGLGTCTLYKSWTTQYGTERGSTIMHTTANTSCASHRTPASSNGNATYTTLATLAFTAAQQVPPHPAASTAASNCSPPRSQTHKHTPEHTNTQSHHTNKNLGHIVQARQKWPAAHAAVLYSPLYDHRMTPPTPKVPDADAARGARVYMMKAHTCAAHSAV
jgi:hypothetical protein